MNRYITDGLLDNLNTNFTPEQVATYANNYLKRGQITQDDYDDIMGRLIELEYEPHEQPQSLSERVEAVEGVTEEMITILNEKGIAP